MQKRSSQRRRPKDRRRPVRTKEPAVFKRVDGTRVVEYLVRYRVNGKQKSEYAPTFAAAKRVKAEVKADRHRGEYRERSKITFAEYAPQWLSTYAGRTSRGIDPGTLDGYAKALGLGPGPDRAPLEPRQRAVKFFGSMRLSEIEPRHIKEYAAEVASRTARRSGKPVKPNTVRLALAPVKALLATAHEEGLIRANPAAGLRLFITPTTERADPEEFDDEEGEAKALTESELQALLSAIPHAWKMFFTFLSESGLRISEAIELRWRDLDLDTRWAHVRRRWYKGRVGLPKGRKKRRIRVSAAMAAQLTAVRGDARDDDLVFTSENGHRIDQSNLMSRVLKPAAANAGVGRWIQQPGKKKLRAESWVGFHAFRHTCATRLFRAGWNAAQVQKFLGHSDPGFTLRTYVHLIPDDLPELPFGEPMLRVVSPDTRPNRVAVGVAS